MMGLSLAHLLLSLSLPLSPSLDLFLFLSSSYLCDGTSTQGDGVCVLLIQLSKTQIRYPPNPVHNNPVPPAIIAPLHSLSLSFSVSLSLTLSLSLLSVCLSLFYSHTLSCSL